MTTTDEVLLIVLTTLLSILLIICIMVSVAVFNVVNSVKRVLIKAETVVDSVESVTDVLAEAKGRLTLFKLISNIMKMTKK